MQHTTAVMLTVIQPQVDLSWNASTSPVSGYNAYRSMTSGGPYTKLNSSLISGTTYADFRVQHGYTYYYVTSSVDSQGRESAFSNEASATMP
jgi:fibronectin type 3 domain-containing protein